MLSLVGIVILPVIKFSVEWNSLHQPASVMRLGAPTIHPSLLWPLLVMAVAMTVLFLALHLKAMRNEILRRRVKALRTVEVRGQRAASPASPRRGERHGSRTARRLHLGRLCVGRSRCSSALVAWLVIDGRRQQRLVDELEARGVRRRSRTPSGD